MSDKTKILDLIPDTLKPQLFSEVAEALEERKKEEEKKKTELTPEEQKMIKDIVNNWY